MRNPCLYLFYGIYTIMVLRSDACMNGWNSYGDFCFRLSTSLASWDDAKTRCSSFGGKLAEPQTTDVLEFIRTLCMAVSVDDGFWIGGTDIMSEGQWLWATTNQDIAVLDWNSGEPNNYLHGTEREHCLFLNNENNAYKMNDRVCSIQYNFICEIMEVETTKTVTTPATDMVSTTSEIQSTRKDDESTTMYGTPSSPSLKPHVTSTDHRTAASTDNNMSTGKHTLTVVDSTKTINNQDYSTTNVQHTSTVVDPTINTNTRIPTNVVRMYANEGDTVTLSCPIGVSVIYDKIFWTRTTQGENLPLPSVSTGGSLLSPDLLMTALRWFDVGVYTCNMQSAIGITVHSIDLTVNPTSGNLCRCRCDYRQRLIYWASQGSTNYTHEELLVLLKPVITQLQKNLTVNKTGLSSFIRKKTCAKDDRVTATRMGYLGAVVLGMVFGLLFLIDLSKLFTLCGRR